MLDHRVQILLDDARYLKVERAAKRRGVSILIDTTVLSYAVGAEHRLREPCRRLLRAHADERIEATTTIEVIQRA